MMTLHFRYLSMINYIIQALLKKPDVMEEVLTDRRSYDNVLCDYCDGEFFHSLDVSENDLVLAFYYDGLEIVNPLGSKRGNHKLGKVIMHSSI